MVCKNYVIKMTAVMKALESLTACYFLFYSYIPLANFYLPSTCLPFIGIWWRQNYHNLTLPFLQERETCGGISIFSVDSHICGLSKFGLEVLRTQVCCTFCIYIKSKLCGRWQSVRNAGPMGSAVCNKANHEGLNICLFLVPRDVAFHHIEAKKETLQKICWFKIRKIIYSGNVHGLSVEIACTNLNLDFLKSGIFGS